MTAPVSETHGLMTATVPSNGFFLSQVFPDPNATWASQPKGVLTITNLSTGATKRTELSNFTYGQSVWDRATDDPDWVSGQQYEIKFAGKCASLLVGDATNPANSVGFNGSGMGTVITDTRDDI